MLTKYLPELPLCGSLHAIANTINRFNFIWPDSESGELPASLPVVLLQLYIK
jgi:hypothetical protein